MAFGLASLVGAQVLRHLKLFGRPRHKGEVIGADELAKVPRRNLKAMLDAGLIEPTSADVPPSIPRRVDGHRPVPKQPEPKKPPPLLNRAQAKPPRKHQRVGFRLPSGELHEGVVTRVARGRGIAFVKVGAEIFEVEFAALTAH